MLANRVSFSLGLRGPSFMLDSACSSSLSALDCAFNAMRLGECDSALVGGTNLLLHPLITKQFARYEKIIMPFELLRTKTINLSKNITELEFCRKMVKVDHLTGTQAGMHVQRQFA